MEEVEIKEAYNKAHEKIFKVYDVFKEYFGEENIDLQGLTKYATIKRLYLDGDVNEESALEDFLPDFYDIIVHWSEFEIKNEFGNSTIIKDLWAKVIIDIEGKLATNFKLNRSTYSELHFSGDYMHSHIAGIPREDFSHFKEPCLGTGPLNNTSHHLRTAFDINFWELFCYELDSFVRVESVAGIPYRYISNLYNADTVKANYRYIAHYYMNVSCLKDIQYKDFLRDFLSKYKMRFAFVQNKYSLGMPLSEFIILLTDSFIEWFNKNYKGILEKNDIEYKSLLNYLVRKGFISRGVVKNGKVCYYSGRYSVYNYDTYRGKEVLTFKGKKITLNIEQEENNKNYEYYFLSNNLVNWTLSRILNILNYRYGRETTKNTATCITEYYL